MINVKHNEVEVEGEFLNSLDDIEGRKVIEMQRR